MDMRTISRVSLSLALAGMIVVASAAPTDSKPATPQQVRELIQVTGVAQRMQVMSNQMSKFLGDAMQQRYPCVPADYWGTIFNAQAQQELLDSLVPVYQKHFTQGDMVQLLKFYHTPVGQKLTREMPIVMKDAMQIGREWGRQHAEMMFNKLRQNGTLDADGRCPAPAPASGSSSIGGSGQ